MGYLPNVPLVILGSVLDVQRKYHHSRKKKTMKFSFKNLEDKTTRANSYRNLCKIPQYSVTPSMIVVKGYR